MRDHTGRRRSLFVDGMDQFQPYQISIQRDYAEGSVTTTLYTRYHESTGQENIYIRKDVHEQILNNDGKVTAETITSTYTMGQWATAIAGNIDDSLWKPINDTWTDEN